MKMTNSLAGKIVLVTGGTGSIGRVVVARLLAQEVAEVRILSRSEQKHVEIRKTSNRVRSYIGDVRDFDRVYDAARGVDFIFHAAAMKHVPECERDPLEAVKTNVIGSANVLRAAELRGVETLVVLSTDKAAEPTSVMGMTKALMERLTLGVESTVRVVGVRFGNVLGTEGSVVPLFRSQLEAGLPLTLTDAKMRRFFMTPGEAADVVFRAYAEGVPGDLFIHLSSVIELRTLAQAIVEMCGFDYFTYNVTEIGVRPGEKSDEVLLTAEESSRAKIQGDSIVVRRSKTPLNSSPLSPELFSTSSARTLTVDEAVKRLLDVW